MKSVDVTLISRNVPNEMQEDFGKRLEVSRLHLSFNAE